MFDDLNKKENPTEDKNNFPSPVPTPASAPPIKENKVEDIYAEVDKVPEGVAGFPQNEIVPTTKNNNQQESKTFSVKKIFIFAIFILILLILAIGSYAIVSKLLMPEEKNPANINLDSEEESTEIGLTEEERMDLLNIEQNNKESELEPSLVATNTAEQVDVLERVDSDGDGLYDDEEIYLGTNPEKIDTDNDGIDDFLEVRFHFTDPLNSDSDGDGYSDGEEIANGYNPNGPGALDY